jgi:hypothetical protein
MFVASFLPTSIGESPAGQSVNALGCAGVCPEHLQSIKLASANTISPHRIFLIIVLSRIPMKFDFLRTALSMTPIGQRRTAVFSKS